MNIILILVDSLNKHALRAYNPDSICDTPVIDALAAKSMVFENHFISSLPCMPARREIFAGRKEFLWRPWGSLEVFDDRMPVILREAGYNTGIVTDHYHYWEEMANGYMQGFSSMEMIRGHETDYWKLPETGPVPPWVDKIAEFRSAVHPRQYYANVKDFNGEEDFFPAKVFSKAGEWLEANHDKGPFYLHIENFDVHEPFDTPEPYASMYTDGNKNDYNIWPPYQVYADLEAFVDQTSQQELDFIKAQYLGKATMVDRWMGAFFQKMDLLGLWDDTMVIFTTDHGHDFAERGVFGKQFPHYDSHANIPLMIYRPGGSAGRTQALTQNVDLFSTMISAAGGAPPEGPGHSRSMLPILDGVPTREALLYGTFGQGACVTDGAWTLFKAPVAGKPLYSYSTMITRPLIVDNPIDGRVGRMPDAPVGQDYYDPTVPLPMWKLPIEIDARTHQDFLFHRAEDPGQTRNLWDTAPGERERMLDLMRRMIAQDGAPPEQFARLGLD